jgi:hypothetical protein
MNLSMNFGEKSYSAVKTGVGFGTALAICISWSVHHSIFWAIVHGIFSWLYVVYYIFFVR